MNQLRRAAVKCGHLTETAHANRRIPAAFFTTPRLFSTEAASAPALGSSDDQFLETPTSGLVYGKLVNNITTYTTKSDIMNVLQGCNLKPTNIRFEYNRLYFPISVMVEFPSRAAFDLGFRTIAKNGNLYNLRRVGDKSQFDLMASFDGKALILRGLPRNAVADDIERFLSGCQFYSSSMEIFLRPLNSRDLRKMAIVRFPSGSHALHAYITKKKGFCLNDQITLQLLH